MFCPSCRDEYREGFTWCRDCDVALVDALPDEAPSAGADARDTDARDAPIQGAAPDRLRRLELGLILLVAFGSSLASSLHHLWVGVGHGTYTRARDPAFLALLDIAGGAAAICVLLYVLSRRGLGLRHIGVTLRWSDPLWGAALLAATKLVPLVLAVIVLSMRWAMPWSWLTWRAPTIPVEALAPLLMLGILCAAANEELIVRAYMMTELLDLTGSPLLAVASSVVFQTLYHFYQGWWALRHVWPFLVYALFYWRTRRATPVVLAHFLTNVLNNLYHSA